MTSAPKVLPWIARKAGIPDDRLIELWHAAVRCTTSKEDWNGSEGYRTAMEQLQQLVDKEQSVRGPS
jgi:hypothetical protein